MMRELSAQHFWRIICKKVIGEESMGVYDELVKIVSKDHIFIDEPMSRHTTFRTGGPADILVVPQSKAEMIEVLKIDAPKSVIGNGSNLLVKDKGIRGLVIKTTGLTNVSIHDCDILAESGVYLSRLSNLAKEHALSGLEFACGIPGTLGGAIMMNASAYGGETANVVVETEYADIAGNVTKTTEHHFGYRTSMFVGTSNVILESKLTLTKGDTTTIEAQMNEFMKSRNEKQPVDKPSAGSTFKRPEGYFAGKLIEDCGLKGYQIGGAQVSEKHAGFIINAGGATSSDILKLIEYVQDKVNQKFGVLLEPEIKIIGE